MNDDLFFWKIFLSLLMPSLLWMGIGINTGMNMGRKNIDFLKFIPLVFGPVSIPVTLFLMRTFL